MITHSKGLWTHSILVKLVFIHMNRVVKNVKTLKLKSISYILEEYPVFQSYSQHTLQWNVGMGKFLPILLYWKFIKKLNNYQKPWVHTNIFVFKDQLYFLRFQNLIQHCDLQQTHKFEPKMVASQSRPVV